MEGSFNWMKGCTFCCFVIFLLWVFSCTTTHAQFQTVDLDKSVITFEIKNMGMLVQGEAKEFQIRMNFNPKNLRGAFLRGSAEVNSLLTDNEERDAHLRKEEYFNEASYPKIYFHSENFKYIEKDKFLVTGYIQIKNFKKNVSFYMHAEPTDMGWNFRGMCDINRLDFLLGNASFTMGNVVRIHFSLVTKTETIE